MPVGMRMKKDILETFAYKLKIFLDKKLDVGNKGRHQYFPTE